jgi:hypothetical protein
MEYTFDFIVEQFAKCERDAHLVKQWLIELKKIPEPVALEVMWEFAEGIYAGGKTYGLNKIGLSELDLAVLAEANLRRDKMDAAVATKILQVMASEPLVDEDFANELIEFLDLLYQKIDKIKDEPERRQAFKESQRGFWTRRRSLFGGGS